MLSRLRNEDRGVALVTVILLTAVTLVLVSAMVSYGVGSLPLSRHDQDWNAALGAANAGLNDYVFRLDQNTNYWQYSKTNPPPDGNQAFSQYVAVPGPANKGQYRYAANTSTLAVDGSIKLTVTGVAKGVKRTVYATVRKRSFLDYLYFTNYETKDPAAYVSPPDPFTPAQAQTFCAKYDYAARDSRCILIYFISQDTINGPLHSNDAIHVSGNPQFNGPTSTSCPKSYCPKGWLGSGSPSFVASGDPAYKSPLTMPPSDSAIKSHTDISQGGTGCLYTGPTQITFTSAGRMTVVSPFTKSTNAGCAPGSNLVLPPNGVVYVQSVPTNPSDPNYTNGCPYSGNYPPGLPVPISGDITQYVCRDGDLFVSGTLKGQVTAAADHNIVVVGNTQYASGVTGIDLLGLIANNYVQVMHPVSCPSSCSNLKNKQGNYFQNPVIQAAILSLQHSFIVQNYQYGAPLGSLSINGAIAQQYRGPVGTFSGGSIVTGYAKAYLYDTRLKYLSPPHFLNPVQAAWQVGTWGEIPAPAFP
jgi:hypothetical protein